MRVRRDRPRSWIPLILAAWASGVWGGDWPQLQHDAARTGRGEVEVAPPYRARWLWFGRGGTLRNRRAEPGSPDWIHDLAAGPGRSYPMPRQVPFTLAGTMQPIVHRGSVFVASQEGTVFAIRQEDGRTAWEADLPGGTLAAGAAAEDVVVFASLRGRVHGYRAADGRPLWVVEAGRAITGAPCLLDGVVDVADHGGRVHAIEVATGTVIWRSERLGAAVQGSLAAAGGAVYAVAEDLKVYALNAADGRVRAVRQIFGQSFRLQWPVIHDGKLWVRTAAAWCVGSEGVNDPLLAAATSLADEEAKFLDWLDGRAVFGPFSSKDDWKTFFALNLPDLSEPFEIPCGPSEGCGQPPNPPAVTGAGDPVCRWPTRFPALVNPTPAFGTRFFIDFAAVDPRTGRRKPFDAGPPIHVWPMETDNLYALTTAGRVGATVANGRLYLCERYGVTAIEHARQEEP